MSSVDVLLVSLGSTGGLRAADEQLAELLRDAGATVEIAKTEPQRQVRTMALTDLLWARACANAARQALSRSSPRAIIYSSATAALFWPERGAIRFDASAAENRAGHHGIWQRPLERRRFNEASLLIPWSEAALVEAPPSPAKSIVVPAAVEGVRPQRAPDERDIAAITYASDPEKKGLDLVLSAWAQARRGSERLLIAGLDAARQPDLGEGVELVGTLDPSSYRELLGRSKIFLCAPRREDFGIAQLEALADGCQLITAPAPGGYVALEIALQLDERLVTDDLAPAIRSALDDPRPDYATRAGALLEPFRRASVEQIVSTELLPALLI